MTNTTAKQNAPALWLDALHKPDTSTHKYTRGHAAIYGAPEFTGATNLAAQGCARAGAGLVSVIAGKRGDLYRTILPPHIIVRDELDWLDHRVTARLYGSGGLPCPVDYTKDIPTVLDADALGDLPEQLGAHYILTPHEGEFARTFPHIDGTRKDMALKAATDKRAIVVLKGASTVIAHPDGRVVVSSHASPYLASAGSGDVLAGIITGLLAQRLEPFQAACAAVWIHGEAGIRIGPGLVASDIPAKLPEILRDFA